MPIRHIIFDCDGVLVDSETLTAEFESELLARFGIHLSPEVIKKRFAGRTARGQWLELAAEYKLDLPPGKYTLVVRGKEFPVTVDSNKTSHDIQL